MNEAKVENHLAQSMLRDPSMLGGMQPVTPAGGGTTQATPTPATTTASPAATTPAATASPAAAASPATAASPQR
jgi:hypothetical protein